MHAVEEEKGSEKMFDHLSVNHSLGRIFKNIGFKSDTFEGYVAVLEYLI